MFLSFQTRKATTGGFIAFLTVLAAVNMASASTQCFTSEADFVKQLAAPYYLETFSGCAVQNWYPRPTASYPILVTDPPDPVADNPVPDAHGYSFTVMDDEAAGGMLPGTMAGTAAGWSTYYAGTMTVTYASASSIPVTAVGGYFFPVDYGGNLDNGEMTVSVYHGTALLGAAPLYTPTAVVADPSDPSSVGSFVGFISTDSITSLTATAAGSDTTCTAFAGNAYVGTAAAVKLPGDANLDGKVDINDLNVVLNHYDATGMTWATGDFNNDQKVDINDLNIVLGNYDRTASALAGGVKAVPEPSCTALLTAGFAALLTCALKTRKNPRPGAG